VSQRAAIRIGMAMLLLILGVSCGLKTPPRLPGVEPPPRVENLNGEWEGREIVLTGKPAGAEGRESGPLSISGARVYHAWYGPGKRPCEGCPISYGGYLEAVPEKGPAGAIICRVPMERDAGTHFFEVRLVGRGNAVGPASDRIKLVVEAPPE